jgi:hypothetical protein
MKTPPTPPVQNGDDMNVRKVHAAIWREQAEPTEAIRRMPLVMKLFYLVMVIWLIQYFFTWAGTFDWNEYEASPIERAKRDDPRRDLSPRN